jgi:hypothetical protein
VTIGVGGGAHANISSALLHNDTEDDAFFYADLGTFKNCIPYTTNILTRVASAQHLGLVDIKNLLERLPL